jgi:lipopolysaccharide export system permease protein
MLKKLDIYIISKFLFTFLFILAMLVSIAIVIDLTEKVGELIAKHVSFFDVATKYYLYFIPYIGSLLGPFFIFIAVIFFTSQLASKSEFIAMLSSGMSYNRILLPYFIAATIIAVLLYFGNNQFVPLSNKARLEFENAYINRVRYNQNKNAHRQIGKDQFLYVDNYNPKDSMGYKMTLERITDGKLTYKLHADRMEWNSDTKKWRLTNYVERIINEKGPNTINSGGFMDTTFVISPSRIFTPFVRSDEMTTTELNQKIEEIQATGAEGDVYFEIEKYRRTAAAFSIYIFTLIGVSIASRKSRGGIGYHLMMGIAMCAAFEIVMKFTTTFSTNANLPAFIGVWLPNFIYSIIAIYFYKKAQK